MNAIRLIGTDDTPGVVLDKEAGKFELSGRSMPEDVVAFFQPILDWIEDYKDSPNSKTVFDFKLTYFNTASSKLLMDILMMLEEMHEDGHEVLAKWHYPSDDEIVEIPFEHIAY